MNPASARSNAVAQRGSAILSRPWLCAALAVILAFPLMSSGETAPGFSLPKLGEGEVVSLADFRGRIVYVDFWASWCGPCRQSFPLYEKLAARLPGQDFQLVAINLDEHREDAVRFLGRHPVSFTVLLDPRGQSASDWKIRAMPSSFLVDPEGYIVHQWAGFEPSHIEEIENEIRSLLD